MANEMLLDELLSWAIPSLPTWEDVEASIRSNLCLCCGRPGHYQEMMDAHVAAHGLDGMGVYVNEKRQLDGNHRLIAARRAGVAVVPLESKREAGDRWVRTHGQVGWLGRKVGDISPEEMAWVTVDVLSRLAPWPATQRDSAPPRDASFDASRVTDCGRHIADGADL